MSKVCVFSKICYHPLFYLKVLQDTLGSQRCSRDCSGVLVVASLEETRWGTLVGSRGMAVASLKETRGGTLVGSGGLAVTSLMETRWVSGGLSWDGGGITQGDAVIALTF